MTRIEEPDYLLDSTVGSLVAYAAGDQIGGVSSSSLQWANAGGLGGAGVLVDVTITLQTATAADLVLVLYNSAFTAGTDNAAFTENAADLTKAAGVVNISSSKFVSMGGNIKRATVTDQQLLYKLSEGWGGMLYGQLLAAAALTLTDTTVHVGLGVYRG